MNHSDGEGDSLSMGRHEWNFLSRIVLIPGTLRLRAGWRLLLFCFILLFFTVPVSLIWSYLPLSWQASASLLDMTMAELVVVTIAVFTSRRLVDRRSFPSLGLHWRSRSCLELVFGFSLGGVLIGTIFFAFCGMHWIDVAQSAWSKLPAGRMVCGVSGTLASIGLLTAWSEELLFRGYVLRNLTDGLRLPGAIVISSVLFALVHLANPGASAASVTGITLAGLMLAYGAVSTGQLWLSIGLHAGWNFFQALLGFPVSGYSEVFHLFELRVHGPAWATGGSFGPEAGIVIVPVCMIGIAGIAFWTRVTLRSGGKTCSPSHE